MADSIYLKNGENFVSIRNEGYEREELLQSLLAQHPELLTGDQSPSEGGRLMLVSREVGVPGEDGAAGRRALEHLFIDGDGVPTLVEVKRSTGTRIRREVVGQMLDYSANAVAYWPVDVTAAFHQLGFRVSA